MTVTASFPLPPRDSFGNLAPMPDPFVAAVRTEIGAQYVVGAPSGSGTVQVIAPSGTVIGSGTSVSFTATIPQVIVVVESPATGYVTVSLTDPPPGEIPDPLTLGSLITKIQPVLNVLAHGADPSGATDSTAAIQAAIDAAGAVGGTVFLPPGTYLLSPQIDTGLAQAVTAALALPDNVTLMGVRWASVLTAAPLAASAENEQLALVVNQNQVNDGNAGITITGIMFDCPAPVQTSTGLQGWAMGVSLAGCSNSTIKACDFVNGSWEFAPLASETGSGALTDGLSSGNSITNFTVTNCTGSMALYKSTNCRVSNFYVDGAWDDPMLISSGTGHKVSAGIINGAPPVDGHGGSSGCIYLENDGSVSNTPAAMSDITVSGITCLNNAQKGQGERAGILVAGSAQAIKVSHCYADNNSLGFSAQIAGASQEQRGIEFIACTAYGNQSDLGHGFDITATNNSTSYQDVSLDACWSGANLIGFFVTGASPQVVAMAACRAYDDQSTITQDTGYQIFTQAGDEMIITADHCAATDSPTLWDVYTSGAPFSTQSRIAGCLGYNPAGPQSAPAVPASGAAFTNPFLFDATVYVSGGTVTEVAIGGTSTGLTSGAFNVPAGESITLTYSAAPTWVWVGH